MKSPLIRNFSSKIRLAAIAAVLLYATSVASAQDAKPLDGHPWELGVWASGGFSVPGGTQDTKVIDAGVRLGKVLTGDHFGSFVRGDFEYSGDLIPVYYVLQPAPALNAYGAAFNPVNLKWNFTRSAHTIPFLELGSGVLFSNHVVPNNTSRVNFITHGTLGFQFFNNQRRTFTASVRYEHISNAGLTVPNPGVNTVQMRLGIGRFVRH